MRQNLSQRQVRSIRRRLASSPSPQTPALLALTIVRDHRVTEKKSPSGNPDRCESCLRRSQRQPIILDDGRDRDWLGDSRLAWGCFASTVRARLQQDMKRRTRRSVAVSCVKVGTPLSSPLPPRFAPQEVRNVTSGVVGWRSKSMGRSRPYKRHPYSSLLVSSAPRRSHQLISTHE